MKSNITFATLAVTALFLSACSSTKVDDSANANATAKSAVAQVVVAPHMDPNSELSKNRSVYFDFDNFTVKKEYASVIERHGKYGSSNSQLKIKVEGNTDERGGREYNLALGQKRAEAVARALKVYGVKDGQVEPVSFGSEKPKAAGHDEASWSQNRRADVAYVGK
jgi:peptidoglycan-associated lipoprotein